MFPVQHLSYPHFEPSPSRPFSGFKASLPVFWGCVGSCGVLFLCSQASLNCPVLVWAPSSPAVTARQVPVAQWGLSHVQRTFSPFFSSCIFLTSLFSILVNPRAAVCSRGLSSGAGSLQCPYKGLGAAQRFVTLCQ